MRTPVCAICKNVGWVYDWRDKVYIPCHAKTCPAWTRALRPPQKPTAPPVGAT